MPKISVILPVYDASAYLARAIDSIIGQTYTDWELIVINDGSTDNSESIVVNYSDNRINYYKNEVNSGLIFTLNKAIGLCSGKYIARMDADDIASPERFERQIDYLEQNSGCSMCGTFAHIIDKDENITGKIIHQTENKYLQINLLFSVPFVHPSMMIRKEVLEENQFDQNYLHAEDYDLWCRIARKHIVGNIPQFLLMYRWHDRNVSVLNSQRQNEAKEKIIRRELEFIGLNPDEKEIFLHKVSFSQFDSKEKEVKSSFSDFGELNKWFSKIIEANKKSKRYDENALIAFLWSRWIVVCIAQKKYRKIYKPRFAPFKISIWIETFRQIVFLSKKK
ncbi:glycosyltransferase family 2 protein [Dysgonomonas macrotermitis]|uniref:Glycosyl transferase family 2 n=1 Tax=Dysgonomonas macrotermitis TaxID=1346286 RepID=A0A1M5I8R1_9BACT|nr:glycosyltransferase family 2 protein [Dysgonomonas macrotermitis]SHG24183.1 Glycosyl transferase family 2 [Dysgonomonas macrotermitis]